MDFVVGHPRSGTMFVSHLLNAGGARVSEHELLPALGARAVPMPTEYYRGRLDGDAIAHLLDRYALRPAGVEVDCNWKLTWILVPLLQRFPQARIVHLIRNPRDNVRSTFELGYYGPIPPLAGEPDARRDHWLKWIPEIDRPDWNRLSPFERNCAFWTETHRLVLAALEGRERTLRVRLEELDSDEHVSRLFAFLQVAPPPAALLSAIRRKRINTKAHEKGTPMPDFPNWSVSHRHALDELCGAMARRLGYAI